MIVIGETKVIVIGEDKVQERTEIIAGPFKDGQVEILDRESKGKQESTL